ncbi:sensor domain-containing diguanylate cyclase [Pseudomonas sp. Gutcm_11s]|uniref:sensor domain-containing diguanylate cyclase n=1 Tax=Pseudomonas sp. Gutcm_11s TaxID=3026088 RepID=UPI00236250AE|nr:sensor domain-containing diguanylate cyclase [Pseudomonas sp. Gutcm_11s]MDD0841732.1 sensor domain-containing diguanylate cyclase [Pseudomonas sp. Gutcm_11s]
MLPAPCPIDESQRQQVLDNLELLDTPAELYLDTLVRLTRELFEVETVLISLVDRDRQWFKARVGLDVAETPRDISFCGHAVAARSPLVVEDARQDPRFSDNPVVTGPPFIRFYAGQPLFNNDQPIGTLCMLHPEPRVLTAQERLRLRDLGTLVEGYLQLRSMSRETHKLREAVDREQRKALIDPLTQLWNRAALLQFFSREQNSARDAGLRLGVIYAELDHFDTVKDRSSAAGADQALWECSRRLSAALRPDDLLVRLGGEEFIAVLAVHDASELGHVTERMRKTIADAPVTAAGQSLALSLSLGSALLLPGENQTQVLERASRALYRAKQLGYNRAVHTDDAF